MEYIDRIWMLKTCASIVRTVFVMVLVNFSACTDPGYNQNDGRPMIFCKADELYHKPILSHLCPALHSKADVIEVTNSLDDIRELL